MIIIHAKYVPEKVEPEDHLHVVYDRVDCRDCKGDGQVKCGHCDGTGHLPCRKCDGNGTVLKEVEVTTEELESRQSAIRQEALLMKRYGSRQVASIRDYWQGTG